MPYKLPEDKKAHGKRTYEKKKAKGGKFWLAYYQKHREKLQARQRERWEVDRKLRRERRKKDPVKYRGMDKKHHLKRQEILAGRPKPTACEVCGGTGRIMFDHDHATGKFRGWLCLNCNTALGHVKDNPAILKGLMDYIIRHYVKEQLEPHFKGISKVK